MSAQMGGSTGTGTPGMVDSVYTANIQSPLRMMAEQTGGLAIYNTNDVGPLLEKVAADFRTYYNTYRVHSSVDGTTPAARAGERESQVLNLGDCRWQSHCGGLYQTPMAA